MSNLINTPAVIAGIIGLIILAGIAFSPVVSKEEKPYTFSIALVAIPVWFLVVYWYCANYILSIAWFFLILPFGIILMWNISKWLSNSCIRR